MKSLKDEPAIVAIIAILLAVIALWAISCGGGGGSYSTPTTPSTNTPAPSTGTSGITVNIVGTTGNSAFTPNPVQAASGTTIVWKNGTSVAHHLVMDSGTVIGDIAAGATVTTAVPGSGGNFHCTNHPTMVGSINGSSAPPDPTPNPSGGYDY